MIDIKGVAHFSIPVTDTKRSADFYSEKLGLKVLMANHERGMVFLDAGGDCVILSRVEGPISTAKVDDVHHAFIIDHDAYENAVKELRAGGVEIVHQENLQGGILNGPRSYFYDPDGNALEIIDLTAYAGAED